MANISRRNFMKVAAGAAGIAGLGLLNGCSKTEAPASSAAASAAAEGTTPAAAAPVTDKLYTASINPQLDESEFRSNTKELTTLFSPLTIGSMEISNRMVKSAAGSATYLAGLTDELLTYYVNLAKGGVALIDHRSAGGPGRRLLRRRHPGLWPEAGGRVPQVRCQDGLPDVRLRHGRE